MTPVVMFVAVFVVACGAAAGSNSVRTRVYAVGNGERVAALSGVPVGRT